MDVPEFPMIIYTNSEDNIQLFLGNVFGEKGYPGALSRSEDGRRPTRRPAGASLQGPTLEIARPERVPLFNLGVLCGNRVESLAIIVLLMYNLG